MLNILGLTYELNRVDKIDDPKTGDGSIVGVCRGDSIAVLNCLSDTFADSTIIHEVVHAISDQTALYLKEGPVGVLSAGIYHFIVSNPEFIKNMLKHANKNRGK